MFFPFPVPRLSLLCLLACGWKGLWGEGVGVGGGGEGRYYIFYYYYLFIFYLFFCFIFFLWGGGVLFKLVIWLRDLKFLASMLRIVLKRIKLLKCISILFICLFFSCDDYNIIYNHFFFSFSFLDISYDILHLCV